MTLLASLVLGIPLLLAAVRVTSPFLLGLVSVLGVCVVAWSMIAGAVGAPLMRKAAYIAGLFLFALAFYLFAYVTGWQQLANENIATDYWQVAAITGYRLVLLGAPVVALVIFAGGDPAVFWRTAAA